MYMNQGSPYRRLDGVVNDTNTKRYPVEFATSALR